MDVDRDQLKRHKAQKLRERACAYDFIDMESCEVVTHAILKDFRKAQPHTSERFWVVQFVGPSSVPSSVPSALGEAALKALGSEQPREVTPEDVYRMMTPLSSDDGGWEEELAEDRRTTTTDDPWPEH